MVSRCQGHDVDLMIVVPRQLERNGEPSHARERRWPIRFEINVNSRRPVMRVDYEVLGCASGSHHCFCFFLCLHRLIHRKVPVAVSI